MAIGPAGNQEPECSHAMTNGPGPAGPASPTPPEARLAQRPAGRKRTDDEARTRPCHTPPAVRMTWA